MKPRRRDRLCNVALAPTTSEMADAGSARKAPTNTGPGAHDPIASQAEREPRKINGATEAHATATGPDDVRTVDHGRVARCRSTPLVNRRRSGVGHARRLGSSMSQAGYRVADGTHSVVIGGFALLLCLGILVATGGLAPVSFYATGSLTVTISCGALILAVRGVRNHSSRILGLLGGTISTIAIVLGVYIHVILVKLVVLEMLNLIQ
jgi:hypothetical protein